MNSLDGKWALITGASRGIGLEVARGLAKEGCNLILCSRNKNHTKEIEEEAKLVGVSAVSLEVQLENMESVNKLLESIDGYGKEVSIIYNIAAVNCNVLDFFQIPEDYYRTTFNTNFLAPITIIQHFIPKMLKKGHGRIICAGSDAHNEPKALPYIVSKQALYTSIREMAYACNGTDLMINMVDPGWCKTDMGTDNAPNEAKDAAVGFLLGAVLDDGISGRYIYAQDYKDYSLAEAYTVEGSRVERKNNDTGTDQNRVGKVLSIDDFANKYDDFIHTSKKKVIFGGGNQAKFFIDVLRFLNCKVDAILCSNSHGLSELSGIPLYELGKFPIDKDECEIAIAITEAHIKSVEKLLDDEGFHLHRSYSVLYSKEAWSDRNGNLISDVYTNLTNTFDGRKL